MYFKCKSCGSNDYVINSSEIICQHCGSSYRLEQSSQNGEKKSKKVLYPILALATIVIVFIISQQKSVVEKPTQTSNQSMISINNTNAQIGMQIINHNTKADKNTHNISGKVVQHTKIKNETYMDDSVGYTKDESGNITNTIYYPKPKTYLNSQGNLVVDNKNINFTDQKIERYRDKNNLLTTIVTTGGFNKKKNILYLDKKGVIPLIGQTELPGGIITDVKLSKDGNILFYISRYDDLFIVDIAKVDKPKVLSKTSILNMTDILLSKDEKKLYLNGGGELAIFDISNKKALKKLGSIPAKEYYKGMVLSPKEDRLYIVKYNDKEHDRHDKLAIVDISDPHHPKERSDISTRDTALSLIIKGKQYNNYILTKNSLEHIILYEKKDESIKILNQFSPEAAWHRFYSWNRDMQFTKNGKYVAFITGKNSISFKRIELVLPKNMVDRDVFHNKDNYFGYRYSSIVQPDIDKIKKIILSKDGTKLLAFSSSDFFAYDISELK